MMLRQFVRDVNIVGKSRVGLLMRFQSVDNFRNLNEVLNKEATNKDGSKTHAAVIRPSTKVLPEESNETVDFEMANGKIKAMNIKSVRELIKMNGKVPTDLKPATKADAEVLETLLRDSVNKKL